METKKQQLEMECVHNQAERTMTLSWLDGVVELVVSWQTSTAVVLVRGCIKNSSDISEMSVEEFMRIVEQCQQSAEQLAVFEDVAA